MDTQNDQLNTGIRQDFGFFGGLSLIFGVTATLLFYKAAIGLNSLIFTVIISILLILISIKLNIPVTKEVAFCLAGSVFLGISNVLTSSHTMQFLNNIGILLLLDFTLIRLFTERKSSGFLNDLFNIIILPFRALASLGTFFIDGNSFIKRKNIIKNDRLRNIIIGFIIAIPLLVIILFLLSSADLLFKKITGTVFDWLHDSEIFIILLTVLLGTVLCYSLLCGSTKKKVKDDKKEFKASSVIGITASAILLLTYILFCGIQILYLFAGGIFVLPEGFTYAEYARRGFFELLAVTCLNILLIIISEKVFEENKLLRAMLTAITACTYIMIASAAYRMFLYIGAYHLTFLRLIVLLFLLIDALVLAGVIISLYNKIFPLFEYSVIVVTVCWVVFSLSRPDYHIANYLISHKDKIESEDIYFLTTDLSYDAAPVVLPLLEGQYDGNTKYYIERYYDRLSNADSRGIRDYNYSYEKAVRLIKQKKK